MKANVAAEPRAKTCCGIVLAGGRGTRLGSLTRGLPKPFVEVAGRPFIEWVLQRLAACGVRRFVISLGHAAERASPYFAGRPADGLWLEACCEPRPLGTGGAVRFAASACEADVYLVANGDSLVMGDVAGAWRCLDDPQVDGVVVGIAVSDTSRYGSLIADAEGRLQAFREKQPGRGLVNAGVYLLRRHLVDAIPDGEAASLEHEIIPLWLRQGARLMVHGVQGAFLDIGTPETLRQAEEFIQIAFDWKAVA
jgi:D-glycero-alpha-D-manno-heptose 1-phosphate guanylyltransferase